MSETTDQGQPSATAPATTSLTDWAQANVAGTHTAMMLDIETFSTAQDALVLSVAAVLFDPYGEPGSIIDCMHVPLTLEQPGSKTDLNTVLWWLGQGEAGAALLQLRKEVPPHSPSQMFSEMHRMCVENDAYPFTVWGNSCSFDCGILRRLAEREGCTLPWSYRDERCFRTYKEMFKGLYEDPGIEGVAHDAAYDAMYQAHVLQQINKALRYGQGSR